MDKSLEGIYKGIIEGDQVATAKGVQSALADGLNPEVILKDSLIAAMSEVGRLFEACEYYVPELLISARAMQTGLKILKPQLITTGVKATGRVVIGTAAGDLGARARLDLARLGHGRSGGRPPGCGCQSRRR